MLSAARWTFVATGRDVAVRSRCLATVGVLASGRVASNSREHKCPSGEHRNLGHRPVSRLGPDEGSAAPAAAISIDDPRWRLFADLALVGFPVTGRLR